MPSPNPECGENHPKPTHQPTYLNVEQVWAVHVEQALVVLQPDLDRAGRVDAVGVLVPGEGVGVE